MKGDREEVSEAVEEEIEVFESKEVISKVTISSILVICPDMQSHWAKLGEITSLVSPTGQNQMILILGGVWG